MRRFFEKPRELRGLGHSKSSKLREFPRQPLDREGQDGDLGAYEDLGGIKFCVKAFGKWFLISSDPVTPLSIGARDTGVKTELIAEDGYIIFASGLIIQWGREGSTVSGSLGTTTDVTFPIAFPIECLNIQGITGVKPDDTQGLNYGAGINYDQLSRTGAQFTTLTDDEFLYWQAIGH
tara:strand:+ start:483 stop:1016 length:534 start_codon:yes stop_codon:yes gene_type:complete